MHLFQMARLYSCVILQGVLAIAMLASTMSVAASAGLTDAVEELETVKKQMQAIPTGPVEDTTMELIEIPGSLGFIMTFLPPIAVGHEAVYRRFLAGWLEYRPIKGSDEGLIILPFRDVLEPIARSTSPLWATFDLSRCGDIGKYISIHIGYKKEKIAANDGKVEICVCPRFLVEQELETFKIGDREPKHPFADIMSKWDSPFGYFWTWGGWGVQSNTFDYLITSDHTVNSDRNLYEKWRHEACRQPFIPDAATQESGSIICKIVL